MRRVISALRFAFWFLALAALWLVAFCCVVALSSVVALALVFGFFVAAVFRLPMRAWHVAGVARRRL